jgi:uncharacterized membrane protein
MKMPAMRIIVMNNQVMACLQLTDKGESGQVPGMGYIVALFQALLIGIVGYIVIGLIFVVIAGILST